METAHKINIIIHVLSGTVALFVGFLVLLTNKFRKMHVNFGSLFSRMVAIVIFTGLAGVLVFGGNDFLMIITLLSGYNCFSGIRAIRLCGRKPALYDYIVPVIVMLPAIYYLYYISSIGLMWNPVVIYSTLGALFVITIYDLSRFFIPLTLLGRFTMYEHSYKMISVLAALLSAFSGTVFPQHKPYSQFLPSALGLIYIFATFIRLSRSPTQKITDR